MSVGTTTVLQSVVILLKMPNSSLLDSDQEDRVMVSATKRKTKGWSCVASFANMQAYHTGF